MAFVPANANEHVAEVVENTKLSERYFLLKVARPANFVAPRAGQFVHMEVPDGGRFFLRRPFSLFDATAATLDLLVVEHGPGTQILRRARIGDPIRFYGPLGNPLPEIDSGKTVLAIGGGVGLAPLYYYGFNTLGECGERYRLLYGGRSRDDLFLNHVSNLERPGVFLSTDDGSHGFRGNVVELAAAQMEENPADIIFSCGPTPMMQAADALARRHGVQHFVSLENRMACALGACRACVVPTHREGISPYQTVCHDGPVFDAADLVMNELPVP